MKFANWSCVSLLGLVFVAKYSAGCVNVDFPSPPMLASGSGGNGGTHSGSGGSAGSGQGGGPLGGRRRGLGGGGEDWGGRLVSGGWGDADILPGGLCDGLNPVFLRHSGSNVHGLQRVPYLDHLELPNKSDYPCV